MNLSSLLAILNVVSVTAFVCQGTTKVSTSTTTSTQLFNDLWGEPPNKDGQSKEMSKALPFAPRPKLLDGSLPGDVGFE
jgi:hypothetical protein